MALICELGGLVRLDAILYSGRLAKLYSYLWRYKSALRLGGALAIEIFNK